MQFIVYIQCSSAWIDWIQALLCVPGHFLMRVQTELGRRTCWQPLRIFFRRTRRNAVVSQLIKAVYVYRDYRLEVEFRVSFDDFRRLCVGCEPNGGRIATVESV